MKRIKYGVPNGVTKPGSTGKITQKSSEKSSEKILTAIASNPDISARQIAEAIGMSPRGIEKQLDKLRTQGVIRRAGPDKGGYWEVVSNPA